MFKYAGVAVMKRNILPGHSETVESNCPGHSQSRGEPYGGHFPQRRFCVVPWGFHGSFPAFAIGELGGYSEG